LEHRLQLAGLERPLFTEPAIEALWQSSQGVMRRIDTLAHYALAAGATHRATQIDPEHVLKAAEETRS
jgi:general secretion pathway protein A